MNIGEGKILQPDEVDVVIYHSPCSDGTGSGFVAWKYLSSKYPDREVLYYPSIIGANPPKDLGKKILFFPFALFSKVFSKKC